jgi:hypothetical protein
VGAAYHKQLPFSAPEADSSDARKAGRRPANFMTLGPSNRLGHEEVRVKTVLVSMLLATSIATASDGAKSKEGGVLEFDYGKCVAVIRALDSYGKPVPGAVIGVKIQRSGPHGDTQVHSPADSDGYVRFLGLPEGKIPFSAVADGRRSTILIDTANHCEGKYDIVLPK